VVAPKLSEEARLSTQADWPRSRLVAAAPWWAILAFSQVELGQRKRVDEVEMHSSQRLV
jgi:hypothetical protein